MRFTFPLLKNLSHKQLTLNVIKCYRRPRAIYATSAFVFKLPNERTWGLNQNLTGLLAQSRSFSGFSEDDRNNPTDNRFMRLPPLCQHPFLTWPKFINSIRNWFFTYFVIKPYFDKEFSIQDFMKGAQEAVSVVSTKLASGEFDDLQGLVDNQVLAELRQTLSTYSVSQRDLIKVASEDIFFSFPYQIGIIIPDAPEEQESSEVKKPQTRYVEITVVLHVLRGFTELKKRSEGSNFSVIDLTKDDNNKYRVMVCNYRFFRDFTDGCKDPSWIINMVNHFLPAEVMPQR